MNKLKPSYTVRSQEELLKFIQTLLGQATCQNDQEYSFFFIYLSQFDRTNQKFSIVACSVSSFSNDNRVKQVNMRSRKKITHFQSVYTKFSLTIGFVPSRWKNEEKLVQFQSYATRAFLVSLFNAFSIYFSQFRWRFFFFIFHSYSRRASSVVGYNTRLHGWNKILKNCIRKRGNSFCTKGKLILKEETDPPGTELGNVLSPFSGFVNTKYLAKPWEDSLKYSCVWFTSNNKKQEKEEKFYKNIKKV